MDLLTTIWLIGYVVGVPTIAIIIGISKEDEQQKLTEVAD